MKKVLIIIAAVIICVAIGVTIISITNKYGNNDIVVNSGDISSNIYDSGNSEKEYNSGISAEKTENQYIVKHNEDYQTVYTFDGQKMIGCNVEYFYETEEEALQAFNSYKEESYETYGIVDKKLEGNKVILIADISEYTQTRADIERVYDALADN